MRIIMFDIDTLRSDHIGCYGYRRNTTPAIDEIASEGVIFDNYYCPNAPCLPSRASLITGQYGIHTGILGHGGTAGDMRPEGSERGFTDSYSNNSLFSQFRKAGMHTVSFSTFAERHSAWWFNSGLNECFNAGEYGCESAESVTPHVIDWLDRCGKNDNWFMHINLWDPHTPYRAPAEFGNPFESEPLSDDWINEEVFAEHKMHIGPHGANEISMWDDRDYPDYPRHKGKLSSLADVKSLIDNYDCGIRYADDNVRIITDKLKSLGVWGEDMCVIVTSDHGENMGELGIYSEHATACESTCHIPLIIKWKGAEKGVRRTAFHDNTDLLPTIRELLNLDNPAGGYRYDGTSFAGSVAGNEDHGRDSLVLSQCAHVCQRSARFRDYIYIRTVHGGYHLFDREMLFNLKNDPHMTRNIADECPGIAAEGARIILNWNDDMMKNSNYEVDPMWTVLREGGPLHAKGELGRYIERLEHTERRSGIARLKEMYPGEY